MSYCAKARPADAMELLHKALNRHKAGSVVYATPAQSSIGTCRGWLCTRCIQAWMLG